MILTSEFLSRWMALKTSGRKTQYQQASMLLAELGSGAEPSKGFRPDHRIPNCRKYELPDGHRIVFQAVDGVPGEYLALFVGSHAEADFFLDTHRNWIWDPKKKTLKRLCLNTASSETTETVRSAELQPSNSDAPESIARPVFGRLSGNQLSRAGVPEEQIERLYSFTSPDGFELLDFLSKLPPNAEFTLMSYLTGSEEQRAEINALLAGERESVAAISDQQMAAIVNSSDEFVDLRDLTEDKLAFESLPFEDWMLYLHPDQKPLVSRVFNGPARLRGVSGSGKTVVAIHRARHIAREVLKANSNDIVLFLTYNRSLCELVERLIKRLCSVDEAAHIHVSTVSQWCSEFIRHSTGDSPGRSDSQVESIWGEIVRRHLDDLHAVNLCTDITRVASLADSPSVQFVRQEIEFIYDKYLHPASGEYLTVERTGRGRRLGANQRTIILAIYREFVVALSKATQYYPQEVTRVAYSLLLDGVSTRYSYNTVIIDEVQDLSDIELKIAAKICRKGLFLVGDGAQKIYSRSQSVSSLGIDLIGRSVVLRKNYRNTKEIMAAANSLKRSEGVGRFDEDPAASQLAAIPSANSGQRPLLMVAETAEAETAAIIREIRYLIKDMKVSPAEICCLARVPALRTALIQGLQAAGIAAATFIAEAPNVADTVRVSTLHDSKGHEYRAVFIAGLYEGIMPLSFAEDNDEELEREAALLYVAITRAKQLLYLSYASHSQNGKALAPSRFLKPMLEHLDLLQLSEPFGASRQGLRKSIPGPGGCDTTFSGNSEDGDIAQAAITNTAQPDVVPASVQPIDALTADELAATLASLRVENARLKVKSAQPGGLFLKISEKRAVSLYGMGRFPTTLYRDQWEKLLANADAIRQFIANHPELK
jgi:superfamily I DNA/RNA helicase